MNKYYQFFFVSIVFIFVPSKIILSQCSINAGNDTILCNNDSLPQLQLGGNPVVINGYPPYTYCWETSYQIGSILLTASDFLNDTSIEHPQLIDVVENNEMLTFTLTVTDSLGNSCVDSVNIRFSNFCYLLKNIKNQVTINQGDSTQLFSGISGGIPPLSFLWMPDYNLSDNTAPEPWASPDTTTVYSVFVEDSAGCQYQSGPVYTVNVIPVGIYQINNLNNIVTYPNPADNELWVEYLTVPEQTPQSVDIFTLDGKKIFSKPVNNNYGILQLDVSGIQAGNYIVKIGKYSKQITIVK